MRLKIKNVKTFVLIIIAILCLIVGIVRTDYREVYNKARIICLECIGIG